MKELTYAQFKEAFYKRIDLLKKGKITDGDFFMWVCEQIVSMGGKLPKRATRHTNTASKRIE